MAGGAVPSPLADRIAAARQTPISVGPLIKVDDARHWAQPKSELAGSNSEKRFGGDESNIKRYIAKAESSDA